MNTIGSFDCSCRVGYSGDCTKGNCDGMLYIFYNTYNMCKWCHINDVLYNYYNNFQRWTFLCFLHFC